MLLSETLQLIPFSCGMLYRKLYTRERKHSYGSTNDAAANFSEEVLCGIYRTYMLQSLWSYERSCDLLIDIWRKMSSGTYNTRTLVAHQPNVIDERVQ